MTDITNDGKAELIIKHGSCEADVQCTFYKYSKGKAVKIETIPFGHSYLFAYPNHKGVISIWGHMWYEDIYKLFVKKSKIDIAFIGGREIKDVSTWIELPYLLDNHVPADTADVSYEALK